MASPIARIDGRGLSPQDFAAGTTRAPCSLLAAIFSLSLQPQHRDGLSFSRASTWGHARRCFARPKLTHFIAQICPQLWADPAHLEQCCGHKQVAVHVTQVQQMDFVSKNFVYRTLPFGEAVKRCRRTRHDDFFVSSDEMSAIFSTRFMTFVSDVPREGTTCAPWARMLKRSLRSLMRCLPLSEFHMSRSCHCDPVRTRQSFPELAAHFTPPDWVHGDTFSSVLRVTSSEVALWMHYDVFDNLLYQVMPFNALPNMNTQQLQYKYTPNKTGTHLVNFFWISQLLILGYRPQANHDVRSVRPSEALL